jgi:ElaB/YqjD/DUF883 family membrane-anchored ribosome-binding protein
MRPARVKQIVRQFPENGVKLLLEDPRNVRDVLAVAPAAQLPLIDFDHMALVRSTFVARDFRHVEADVVLTAPLHTRGGAQRRRVVWLYFLIEHQSEPDLFMPIRLLDYIIQIIKAQMRAWTNKHDSLTGFRVQPVLPLVLYTGTARWESVGRLIELVDLAEHFREVTPDFKPLFLNLPALEPERLISAGGCFGRVLRLLQGRKARPADFRRLVHETVQGLAGIAEAERLRWLELLSYIHMLVYHERTGPEQRELQEIIEMSVKTDQLRQEIQVMKRTIAEEMQEEGRRLGEQHEAIRSRQQMLLRLLRARFTDIPAATIAAVEACRDVDQLNGWFDRAAVAKTLGGVGIRPSR